MDREFTVELPMIKITSDSGNGHWVDVVSVLGVLVVLYLIKRLTNIKNRKTKI